MSKGKIIFSFFVFLTAGAVSQILTPVNSLNAAFDALGAVLICALLIDWFVDISKHITDRNTRRYLKTVCVLCIFWIAVKVLRWNMPDYPILYSYLWYAYYIPIVLLPLFSLYIALYTGKLPGYRPHGIIKFLYLPAAILIALVLTNNFHNLVFTVNDADAYSYNTVHHLVRIWAFILMFISLGILYRNSKIPESRHRIYIPFISVAVYAVYLTGYLFLSETLPYKVFDFTAATVWLAYVILNCLCLVGLIPSNRDYEPVFRNSSVNAFITDENNNVIFRTGANAESGIKADINEMTTDSAGFLLKKSAINGGFVYRIEDVTAINEYISELNETRELLENENEILKADNEVKGRNEKIRKKIELYEDITSAVKPQTDRINGLLGSENPGRETMAEICFLSAYIKRKSNLILLSESSEKIPLKELYLSIRESLNYAALSGTEYSINMQTEAEVPCALITDAYDSFESILEDKLTDLAYIYVVCAETENGFTLSILTEDRGGEEENFSRTFVPDGRQA